MSWLCNSLAGMRICFFISESMCTAQSHESHVQCTIDVVAFIGKTEHMQIISRLIIYMWASIITHCLEGPRSQLPHSYYFTTRILFLKFTNKGVFFEEIQDSHFPRKGGILVLTSMNLEKEGLILMSSVLLWKWEFIWTEKSVFYHKKGCSFWTEKSVFCCEKEVSLSWKISVLPQKMV